MRSVPYPVKRHLYSNRHTGTKPHEAQSRPIGRLANTDPHYIDKFYVKQYYGEKMTHYNNISHKKLFFIQYKKYNKTSFYTHHKDSNVWDGQMSRNKILQKCLL